MGTSDQCGGGAAPAHDTLSEATAQIAVAALTKKCWSCDCLRHALDAIAVAVPANVRSMALQEALAQAGERLLPQRYDCLGCDVCYPAVALNAVGASGGCGADAAVCPTEPVESRVGWPPLPGSYRVLRYRAPVALCTLNSPGLVDVVAAATPQAMAIAGTLQTENLGIERLIRNVVADPFIRFLVVCGDDGRQVIGHLPGQSLVALAREGIDTNGRIRSAKGKRPLLRNLDPAAILHFRRNIEVIDLVGTSDVERISAAIRACAARDPGAAEPFAAAPSVKPLPGSVPDRMTPDPAGYFVLFIDRARKLLSLEHYQNSGVLTVVIEGRTAAELYMAAIDHALLSRLDHAAYLGRELARAEHALAAGDVYVQDAAPERCTPGCARHSQGS